MRWLLALIFYSVSAISHAGSGGVSPPDPFLITEPVSGAGNRNTNGKTVRDATINPALKTLVLFSMGQSIWVSILPTLYLPTNSSVIDNLNIYDGALYSVTGTLLSTTDNNQSPFGPGHILPRIADKFITAGKFDRVIMVPLAIGGTTVDQWGNSSGILYDRVGAAMRRLAARGITPSTTGVTFAAIWGQGESDFATSQASYTSALNGVIAKTYASGFSGRFFVCLETWQGGAVTSAIRAAQAAVVNGTTVFQGGDLDTLNNTFRQVDGTHPLDTFAASAATLVYNAMVATGAPF